MNKRCWHITLCGFLIMGCHGQQTKERVEKSQKVSDSVVALIEKSPMVEGVSVVRDSMGQVKEATDTAVKKVTEQRVTTISGKGETLQTVSATIWSDEQIDFLNQVEKILLFNVRITEIGSRKLELDSQLSQADRDAFVQVLLHPESYPDTSLVESNNGKKFEPDYQMLLETEAEKLTLMFDAEGLYMMVANLYGREKYPISPSLMEQVENLKKKE